MRRKKSQKTKNSKLILWSTIIISILIILAVISYLTYSNIIGYYQYETSVSVGDYVGINLNTDKINFGTVLPGGHSKREVFVNSSQSGYVILRVSGPMEGMIQTFDKFDFVNSGEQKSFVLYAAPPYNIKQGTYNSTIHVYVLKNKCALLEAFLKGKNVIILGDYDSIGYSGAKVAINISYPNGTIGPNETDNFSI